MCLLILTILWTRKKLQSRTLSLSILLFQPSLLALILDAIKIEYRYQHVRHFHCLCKHASVSSCWTHGGRMLPLTVYFTFCICSLNSTILQSPMTTDTWPGPNKTSLGWSFIYTSPSFPWAHCSLCESLTFTWAKMKKECLDDLYERKTVPKLELQDDTEEDAIIDDWTIKRHLWAIVY